MRTRLGQLGVSCAAITLLWGCSSNGAPAGQRSPAEQVRREALARARVFHDTARPEVLRGAWTHPTDFTCRYVPIPTSGTSPKFTCELEDGTRVKVKYGNPEVPAELAASRLLQALGFGADRMQLASRVRCYGCPATPFYVRRAAESTPLGELVRDTPDYTRYRDFTWTAVEQKLEGESLEGDSEGWGFFELEHIDPARGGATREEVDALRLIAIFLVHWDNKSPNQRLVCLPPSAHGSCTTPLVMLQDVGATFGPRKVDLDDWRDMPVWADDTGCRVSMASLPHDGGTFPKDVHISDGGRRLLASRLAALSRADVVSLFTHARFPGRVEDWVDAFQQKVDQIASRRCAS